MPVCPQCKKEKATIHPTWGVIPCFKCRNKNSPKASKQIEFTTDEIKQQRAEYAKDIIQPFRKGELSKEYLDIYGEESARQIGATDKEIENAKPTWGDLSYYGSN